MTVHDLPLYRFPDEGQLPRWGAASARRARAVVCPSNFAADEVRRFLSVSKVEVIPYGLSEIFDSPAPASDEDIKRLGVDGPFVLHAAGATLRKNLPALAEAWGRVVSRDHQHWLVLAGPPDARRDRAFARVERVAIVGKLPAQVVATLMARAAAVVVPSLYEGFGLPALEAMAAGAPVVASKAGALPEVCGKAAVLVEPTGIALAEGLIAVLHDRDRADELRARGRDRCQKFSWDAAGEAHEIVYSAALTR